MKVVRIEQHGTPDVLQVIDLPLPTLSPASVLVRNRAVGVNYVDVQHRQGGYYPVTLPLIPGTEAAGVVEAVGDHVKLFKQGDRVAYAGYMGGNYAEYTAVPEDQLVPIPEGLDFDQAAAGLLQAMTAHCLTHTVYPVQPSEWVLVHAAAGGVGNMLVQLAKLRGARVIGTVSSESKRSQAQAAGADAVIVHTTADFAQDTLTITGGAGVHVVYDAVGKDTFDGSLAVLRKRGWMVVYGQTSGGVPPFDINRLSGITHGGIGGSLFLTWAALSHYNETHQDLRNRADAVFTLMLNGQLQVRIHDRLPLAQAAQAHQMLEDRGVIGKLLLIP